MQTDIDKASRIREISALFTLAAPIITNGLLESSYGFINTYLVSQLGQIELAATALVSMLFVTVMIILWGLVSSTSVIISHYHGAKNHKAIRGVLRDAMILVLILSLPIMVLLWYADHLFLWTGQSTFIVHESRKYLHALTWAVPSDLVGFVIMQFFQGISRPRMTLIFTLICIPLLVLSNYILIFGKFGFPELGLAGIGWGTTFAYTFILTIMAISVYFTPKYRSYFNFRELPKTRYFGELLKVGLPLGGMYSIEIGYFLLLAIFMGKISQTTLAAHQIVLQFFWISMTIIFSIGQAFSIRVGWRCGRGEPEWILPIANIGLVIVFIYGLFITFIFTFFPQHLIALDFGYQNTSVAALSKIASSLFICAGLFQLVEGARLTLFSILRGLKDTRFTMINSIFTFWGIALPIGYSLAFHFLHKNPIGLWIGLIISAIVSSLILKWRLKHINKISQVTFAR